MAEPRFSEDARKHYKINNLEELTHDLILQFIEDHKSVQVPRLDELDDYYDGNNVTILDGERRQDNDRKLADHRIIHPFAEMITNFMQGYMVGVPVQTEYTHIEESQQEIELQERIDLTNELNDEAEHNSEIVANLSVYGRAYELVYRNEFDENKFALVSPLEAFVIYDTTVEMHALAAIRYYETQGEEPKERIELYTAAEHIIYDVGDNGLVELERFTHNYNAVPLFEYQNNRSRIGDFEKILSLIDAYDAVESDTANYITDLPDSLLGIFGNIDEGLTVSEATKMKESRMMLLRPSVNSEGVEGKIDAKYLYKEYDVQGSEAYKDRITNDILMFTNTPNMQDTKFAAQQSGEAMKYKLFGLEQKRIAKVRLMTKGLRNRWKLIGNIMRIAKEGDIDVRRLNFKFTANLPADIDKEVERLGKLGAVVSNETALMVAPTVVSNAQEEQLRIESETGRPTQYPEEFEIDKTKVE